MTFKNTLTTIALICSLFLQAGHEKGGIIITYKSLLGATGDSLKYELTVFSIYDKLGPAAPYSLTINLTSSCFSASNISLPRTGVTTSLLPLLGADYCSSTNSINATSGLAIYSDTIVLPGKCADFRFAHSSGFSRYSATANILNGFQTAFFKADLNNLYGPNSVPTTNIVGLIQAACLNKPLNLYGFTEPDGDSVAYAASSPSYLSGSSVVNFSYNTGYSALNPVNSSSGYNVNLHTGLVQTQVNSVGNFVLTIEYSEYRKDTANVSILVGQGKYILYLVGSGSCNSAPFDLSLLNGSNLDSINCGQSEVKVATTRKIAANSLTANGSEFVVTSSKNGILPISTASVISDSIVSLNMQNNISANDTLWIWSKNGSDSDVLISHCGKEITAFQDTLVYYSPLSNSPTAQFSHNTSGLIANYTTTLPTDSVIWDFGDGSPVSGIFNPSHNYASGGTYTVQLVVFNLCGLSDTTIQPVLICDSISSGINHVFSGDSVSFNALNPSTTDAYFWNLGDGSLSFDSSFVYQYNSTGIYTVTLIVVNACGDSATYVVNVEYCVSPEAIWTAAVQSSGGSGMLVNFDGTQSKGASNFIWDFGDGNSNTTTLTPSHNYVTPNLTYVIRLTIVNNCNDSDSLEYSLGQISIGENNQTPAKIYPNPTSNSITIEGLAHKNLTKIQAFNHTGISVFSTSVKDRIDKEKLDTSLWVNGQYILKLEFETHVEIFKIIVQH